MPGQVNAAWLVRAANLSQGSVYMKHGYSSGVAALLALAPALHAGDDSPQSRFTFLAFRVLSAGPGAIAYVRAEGPVGIFQAILKRDGRAGWRKVWGEGDGGSNSCDVGARHYAWALDLLRTYTATPDAVFPGIVLRTGELRRMAKTDPDLQCVGDLDGGPG
jgi:hypothetical protein